MTYPYEDIKCSCDEALSLRNDLRVLIKEMFQICEVTGYMDNMSNECKIVLKKHEYIK